MPSFLETPRQLAARVGITERQVRSLISADKIEYVMIGCRVHIPEGAFERFVEETKVKPCRDATKAPGSAGSPSAGAGTSSGPSSAAAASARSLQRTLSKLKSDLRTGSKAEATEAGRVIPMRSS